VCVCVTVVVLDDPFNNPPGLNIHIPDTVCERANLYSMCSSFEVYIVACRIYHTVVLDDPFDDPPGLAGHVPDQSPQLTREQLDVSQPLSHSFCLSESCSGFCYCSTSCVTHTHLFNGPFP